MHTVFAVSFAFKQNINLCQMDKILANIISDIDAILPKSVKGNLLG